MMDINDRKVELLAPAGSPEKLEIAIHYGADAVYLSGKEFSLRNFSANFSLDELWAARRLTREKDVRMYVAVNVFSHDDEKAAICNHLSSLADIEPDAMIVADPAILVMARSHLPEIPIHISTQANTTNATAARFWKDQGAVRINVARELTLQQIQRIAENSGMEVEAFVHGAMCMAYSGRCLLSGYMRNRHGNRGECCQPCRFHYTVMEETRPGQYFPIAEDPRGAYVFNSRDLCMIDYLPAMIRANIVSLKIEGRMKSIHYLAGVVKVYREAIDAWYADPDAYEVMPQWKQELAAISNRGYCTGFYLGDPDQTAANVENINHPGFRFVAKVVGQTKDGGARVMVKNRIFSGDRLDVLSPKGPTRNDRIEKITDETGMTLSPAQPGTTVTLYLGHQPKPLDMIRIPLDSIATEAP